MAIPIVPLLVRAFADDAAGFRTLLAMPDLGSVLWMTVILGVGAAVVAMFLGVTLALCVRAIAPRTRRYLSALPVLPMVIPNVAHVIGFVFLLSPENGYLNVALRSLFGNEGSSGPFNVYSPEGIVLYTGLNLTAIVYLFVYTGLRNLGTGYSLAARVNGAGGVRTLLTVTLPLLRPVLVYAGSVALLLSLGQFTGPLILGRREGVSVITTKMFNATLQYPIDYSFISAMGFPLVLVALVLVVFQRRFIGQQNRFVGRVDAMESSSKNRLARALSITIVIGFGIVSAGLPLLALLFVAVSPFWSGTVSLATMTFQNFALAFENEVFISSIWTSIAVSGVAVLLVIPLGLFIALGIQNRARLWAPIPVVLDTIANIPLSMPAALLGFGYLFVFTSPGLALYGTPASFILAYITLMIPYSVRYQLATLVALGHQTVDASRVSGAGHIRTLLQIILPLSRAGIASSAAIMFILLIQEFGVSLLLRSRDVNVMSVVLFEQYDTGSYPIVAVMALVMTAITAAGVGIALLFGGSRALERL
ncbi:ABC transporter permease subunit [Microbacterium sp. zg.B185]|nr:ABC transporter permease subunit [Microbacterium sp. zg.B185]